uniref:Tail fiber protein n=1 Tax=Pseudomonas phage HRDY3 TaxID=3236930 RepID=A0AB39CDF1_9VIRU
MTDKLVLLDAGEQALNNASAGGILIKPVSFKMGDSDLYASSTQHTDIVGNYICGGQIHHVETLSARVCRFVLTIDTRGLTQPTIVKETVVFFEGNVAFGRAVFSKPYTLNPDEPVRLSVVLATSRADLTTINVSVGEHESIPATAFVYMLPSPANSDFNVISVLNGKRNPDGTSSPVLAKRYGAGSFQWSFSDHLRVFNGTPASATSTTFKITSSLEWAADEQVLVHVVAGSGEGQTRRYRWNAGAKEFRDPDARALPNLAQATIAIWKMVTTSTTTGGGGGNLVIPGTDEIPQDWVLTPGADGTLVWQPPKAASRIISTLYTGPSKLDVNALNFMGTGDVARYSTGELVAENANYIYPAVGLTSQHRSAFQLSASELEFAENIPSQVPVDLRVFTKSPSTGTRAVFTTLDFVGDGSTVEYDLGQSVDSPAHVFCFVASTLQPITTYSIDNTTNKLRMIGPVEAGLDIEFRLLSYVQETGYSTRVVTKTYITSGETYFLKLPTKPQSIEQVFVSQSGAHIHEFNYTLIDDALVFTASLESDVEVEVMVFENIQSQGSEQTGLNGIVIDGYVSNKNLVLLRHGAAPVELPIPAPKIAVGDGLNIDTSTGTAMISLNDDAFPSMRNFRKWSVDKAFKNSADAVIVQTITLSPNQASIYQVVADFSAKLGPGYQSAEGTENIEFVIGTRSAQSKEPEFGRQIRGTGQAGVISNNSSGGTAYANASMTQLFQIDPENHTADTIDIVAKMRVNNANTAQFGVLLTINLNIIEIPI